MLAANLSGVLMTPCICNLIAIAVQVTNSCVEVHDTGHRNSRNN
jgi:hypothetical protein